MSLPPSVYVSQRFSILEVNPLIHNEQIKNAIPPGNNQSHVCPHCDAQLPSWISENDDFVKYLFGDDSVETTPVTKEEMTELSNRLIIAQDARVSLNEPVRWVFMSVGSHGSPTSPNFAVASICYPNTTVVGLEALNVVRRQDYEHVLVDSINQLRSREQFKDATIVLDVEAYNAMEASYIQAIVQGTGNVLCIINPELQITAATNKKMAAMFGELLRAGDIRIGADLVCSNPNPERLIGRAFSDWEDSVCFALQRACYCRHQFMSHSDFQHLH